MPKTSRQNERLAELGEDLRSQIEEKEGDLGRTLNNEEVSTILKRCGPPVTVASRLWAEASPHRSDAVSIYSFVLRMVLFWILIPAFVFIVGPTNIVRSGRDWGTAVASTMGNLWSGLFIAAGVITLVFAILDRTHAQMGHGVQMGSNEAPGGALGTQDFHFRAGLRIGVQLVRPDLAIASSV